MNRTVIVAGAGPTGLVLAVELALAGVHTVVVERRTERAQESEGMAVHGRTLQMLRRRGLGERLAQENIFAWPRTPFAFFWLDLATVGEQDHTYALPQWRTERLLEERAVELGVEIRRGYEIVQVDQDDEGVTVRMTGETGDEELRGAYLVGCDGVNSVVRQQAGISFESSGLDYYGVLGDVTLTDGAHDQFDAGMYPAGIFGALPLQPGMLRLMTIQFERQAPGEDVPVTVDELREAIGAITGRTPDIGEVRFLSRFGGRTRLAEQYRKGRVFLAGDAAHVLFISGSQGLNTGVHDAWNLGWKLAATVNGWAPDGLLDTYHGERHLIGQQVCAHARAQMALIHPQERMAPLRQLFGELLESDEVNRTLLEAATATRYPMEHPGEDAPHPLLGEMLPEFDLETPDGKIGVSDKLHAGRGVLLDFRGTTSAAAVVSDHVDVVAARPVGEVNAAVLLVRPDGHVAFADRDGTNDEGLRLAIKTWFG